MDMKTVDSSMISAIGYDSGRQVLRVKFHRGKVAEYKDVPKSEYRELLEAESVGTAFNYLIKDGGYEWEYVDAD